MRCKHCFQSQEELEQNLNKLKHKLMMKRVWEPYSVEIEIDKIFGSEEENHQTPPTKPVTSLKDGEENKTAENQIYSCPKCQAPNKSEKDFKGFYVAIASCKLCGDKQPRQKLETK